MNSFQVRCVFRTLTKTYDEAPETVLIGVLQKSILEYLKSKSMDWFLYDNQLLLQNELFHDGCPYHVETSPLICKANQRTGSYMTGTSVMKELIWSSCLEVFCKKAALKNFAKFTVQHQCQSLFLMLQPWKFIKKRLQHRFFSLNFRKFFRLVVL